MIIIDILGRNSLLVEEESDNTNAKEKPSKPQQLEGFVFPTLEIVKNEEKSQ